MRRIATWMTVAPMVVGMALVGCNRNSGGAGSEAVAATRAAQGSAKRGGEAAQAKPAANEGAASASRAAKVAKAVAAAKVAKAVAAAKGHAANKGPAKGPKEEGTVTHSNDAKRGPTVTSEVRPPKASDLEGYIRDLGTEGKLVAVFETSMGTITCELFEKQAPMTVANFVGLARGLKAWRDPRTGKTLRKPFFDGLTFHRVIPRFMIQGGDPRGNGTGGPGYRFADEFVDSLRFDQPGRLAMANAGPATNGSQFFITEVPTPHLNHRHTIFGQCSNLDVVKAIARVPKDPADPTKSRPREPVIIKKVTIKRQP